MLISALSPVTIIITIIATIITDQQSVTLEKVFKKLPENVSKTLSSTTVMEQSTVNIKYILLIFVTFINIAFLKNDKPFESYESRKILFTAKLFFYLEIPCM